MSLDQLMPSVAAHGLPGERSGSSAGPLDEATWKALLRRVSDERLAGLLLTSIDDDRIPATAAQREEAAALHRGWCASVLRLERRLLDVTSLLADGHVESLVLKGSAMAHLSYPDPALRLFGDTDLLVRPQQYDHAIELLCSKGYSRQTPQARPGFERRFAKGVALEASDGLQVDLHCNLVCGTFGFLIDIDELFESSVEFRVGGRSLRALGPETRLLHACYNAALGDAEPRYTSVRDVAQLLLTGNHELERVMTLIHDWQAKVVVARAADLCQWLIGVDVGGPIVSAVSGHRPTRRENRAVASYVGRNHGFAAKVIATLPYLASSRERAAFLRATLFPEREFVVSHGGRPGLAWVRRGVRSGLRGGSNGEERQ